MRFVIQRVSQATVRVDSKEVAAIGPGLLVLVGFGRADQTQNCESLLEKLFNLRLFDDDTGKMNYSVRQVGGSVLFVPQFTLYADTARGNRPSFMDAAPPELGEPLFDHLISIAQASDVPVAAGVFRAHMEVELTNVGPVTLVLEAS